jgi:hypothetical protein
LQDLIMLLFLLQVTPVQEVLKFNAGICSMWNWNKVFEDFSCLGEIICGLAAWYLASRNGSLFVGNDINGAST